MSWLELLLKIQPIVAAVFALGFVVIYQLKGKWWKTAIGRHMMGFMSGVLLILGIGIVVRLFPDLPNILWIRFISWNLVIILMAWRFILAFRVFVLNNYDDTLQMREEYENEEA